MSTTMLTQLTKTKVQNKDISIDLSLTQSMDFINNTSMIPLATRAWLMELTKHAQLVRSVKKTSQLYFCCY